MRKVHISNLNMFFPMQMHNEISLKKSFLNFFSSRLLSNGERRRTKNFSVLQNVNFLLQPGDKLAIFGLNGSGKTTLLRLIAGAYEPDEGEVSILGKVNAMIDPNTGNIPFATGFENTSLKLSFYGEPEANIEKSIKKIHNYSGLGEQFYAPIYTYSSGMIARLNLSTALLTDPDILLLDEWLSVSDMKFAAKFEEDFTRFVTSSNILILATHNLNLASRLCNKGLILHEGRQVFFGSLHESVEHYKSI